MRYYPGDPGSHDNATRAWQDRLHREGYLEDPASGVMDKATEEAIEAARSDYSPTSTHYDTLWAAWGRAEVAVALDEAPSGPFVDLTDLDGGENPDGGDDGDDGADS